MAAVLDLHRHSSIYAVNVGTQMKNRGSKNRINRGCLNSTKGEENRIELSTMVNRKITEIETAEIEECLYLLPNQRSQSGPNIA